MKSLMIEAVNTMYIQKTPCPKLAPGKAVIKIDRCGVCGTELSALRGTSPIYRYPLIPGHEAVGTIVEIADNDAGFMVGDRVSLEPYVYCEDCHTCDLGRYNTCVNLSVCGVHQDGMMTEYKLHEINLLHHIPDEMTFAQGALIEPLSIALQATARLNLRENEYVLITGAGPIGILCAIAAKEGGAIPIVVDIEDERLEVANQIGLTYTFNSGKGNLITYLSELTCGRMPTAMVECTGAMPIIQNLVDYVSLAARITLLGWPKGEMLFDFSRIMRKDLTIHGSRNSCYQFPKAIDMISRGVFDTALLATKTCTMDSACEVFRDCIKNPKDYLKLVVLIDEQYTKGK